MKRHMSSTDVVPPRTASVYAMYEAARAISGVRARCAGSMWFSSHSHSAIDSAVPRSRPEWRWALCSPGITACIAASTRAAESRSRVAGHLLRRSDGGDHAIDDEHRPWVVDGPRAVDRQDDAVVDQDVEGSSAIGSQAREPLDVAADLVEVAGAPVVVDP